MKKKVLGKGLNDLGLDELLSTMKASMDTKTSSTDKEMRLIPVHQLQPGKYQPRKDIDPASLQELADSIQLQGIIQPIIIRSVMGDQQYEIIAGERRWRAAQLAGLLEVPCIIRNISDDTAIAMALIENIQRENLNAIEEASALQRLIDEFSMTHLEVARVVSKSRATITNLLRLLSLNHDVKRMVEKSEIEMGHARALLALEGEQQSHVARHILLKRMSVRETEDHIRKIQEECGEVFPRQRRDQAIVRMERELTEKLGVKVGIRPKHDGSGQLIIHYQSPGELEGILASLNGDV